MAALDERRNGHELGPARGWRASVSVVAAMSAPSRPTP